MFTVNTIFSDIETVYSNYFEDEDEDKGIEFIEL